MLFTRDGYDETSIDVIATHAGVSPGTVYNYFGTKGAVLLGVVAQDLDDLPVTVDGAAFDELGPSDAIVSLVLPYVDAMVAWGKGLLRTIISAGFDPTEAPALEDLLAIDEHAVEHLAVSFEELRGRTVIDETVDARTAAILVYSVVAAAMLVYASDPTMSRDDVVALIGAQLAIVWRGLAPATIAER